MHYTNKNQNFRENRLIFDVSGRLGKIFSPSGLTRTQTLNDNSTAGPFNEGRIDAASREMQTPLSDAINATKSSIDEIKPIPKNIFKTATKLIAGAITMPIAAVGGAATKLVQGTAKIATHVVTAPIGLAGNVLRAGADVFRLPPRAILIAFDMLAEGVGKISTIARSVREAAIGKIDGAANRVFQIGQDTRGKVYNVLHAEQ